MTRQNRRAGVGAAMLNEWSDRVPPGPPRPCWRTGDFWCGVLVAAVIAALLLSAGEMVGLLP
ncbi:MAG: hypothetical protein ACJ8EB_09420 [Allosphingosinicella sp.]